MLNGRAVLWHAVRPFVRAEFVAETRVVVAAESAAVAKESLAELAAHVEVLATGGATRAESARAGLRDIPDNDWAMIHDAARPCLRDELLENFWRKASRDDIGGLLATPVESALKIGEGGRICETVLREEKYLAQTPQMFRAGVLRAALDKAAADSIAVADESQAMEHAGFSPLMILGEAANIKITYSEDVAAAAALLSRAGEGG